MYSPKYSEHLTAKIIMQKMLCTLLHTSKLQCGKSISLELRVQFSGLHSLVAARVYLSDTSRLKTIPKAQ